MTDALDWLLRSICHREGDHAALLPLCLRCSSVYAGVLVGALFEAGRLVSRRRSGRSAVVLGGVALALMAVVGFGQLYGVLRGPEVLSVFAALWFGGAIAFFAANALAQQASQLPGRRHGALLWRLLFVGLLAGWAACVATDQNWALRALGACAVPGFFSAFLLVNAALAGFILSGVSRKSKRMALLAPVVLGLVVMEFALFAAWRAAHSGCGA